MKYIPDERADNKQCMNDECRYYDISYLASNCSKLGLGWIHNCKGYNNVIYREERTCDNCLEYNNKVKLDSSICGICFEYSHWKSENADNEQETGYWWCPECKDEIAPVDVTFSEMCVYCGSRVIAKQGSK